MGKLSLSEILKLDISNQSIKRIDSFLADEVNYSDSYMKAISYKALIMHKLGDSFGAINLLEPYIRDYRLLTPIAIISICDSFIAITLDLNKFDDALKYIDLKKTFLPASKMNLYLKDMIDYLLKKEMINEAKETLKEYLKDDISPDEALFAKEELANIYFKQAEYDEFINITDGLLEIYQSKLDLYKEAKLWIRLVTISLKKENYIKVVSEINKIIDNYDYPDIKLELSSLAMKAYMALNDFRRAGIFESNYEEFVSDKYPNESTLFLNTAIELYDNQNSKVAANELRQILKDITNKIDSEKKKKKPKIIEEPEIPTINISSRPKPPTEIKIDDIKPNITALNPKDKEHVEITEIREETKNIKHESISLMYDKLSNLTDILNQMNLDNKFREIFRLTMIEVCKVFDVEEAYILDCGINVKGMHYKMERVYDKKITLEKIKGTLNLSSFEYNSEYFLDQADRKYNINIINLEEYPDDYYGYSLPLHNNNDVVGSIAYLSKKPFMATEMAYEGLKMVTALLNSRLILSIEKEKLILNNKKLYFLKDHMSLGIKEEMEGYIHLSEKASQMLGVYEDLSLDDYYNHIPTGDLITYKTVRNDLYGIISEAELEYDFKVDDTTKRIKESFYSLMNEGTISIMSILEDITDYKNEMNALEKIAYTNPTTKLDTELKLMVELRDNYESHKLSLAAISIQNFQLYEELYGLNSKRQLELAVGTTLKEAMSSDFNASIYHLGEDLYAILIKNANDKRLIDSKLNQFMESSSKAINKMNSKIHIMYNAGVYRLGKNTKLDDASQILGYALDALNDAKREKVNKNHISHYDSEEMRDRFKENNLVYAINEAIDVNGLNLVYQQIADIENKKVFGYYVMINLDSSELYYDAIMEVVRKRDLEARINQYAINALFIDLKTLYSNTKVLFPVFIEINPDLLDRKTFEYIKSLPQFYKITPSCVSLVVKSANNSYIKALRYEGFKICSMDILDVFRDNSDYFVYDYRTIGDTGGKEIEEIASKHNVVVIAGGVDIETDIEKAKENNFKLVFGRFYKRTRQMKDLITRLKGNK